MDAMDADDLEGALFFVMLRRPRKKSEKDRRPGSDEESDVGEPRFRSSALSWGPGLKQEHRNMHAVRKSK